MEDERLRGISCFSGIGGLDLALQEDVRTVCYIEWDDYCQEVLKKRMQEGWLDEAPIWSDICSFNGKEWAGRVDIVFGGFPCQDISVAGKGAGIKEGTRSGLFFELDRVVREVRPRYVFLENVSAITRRGFDIVLGRLYEGGYDAVWTTVKASDVGAPHRRERWFCLAINSDSNYGYPQQEGKEQRQDSESCRVCGREDTEKRNLSDSSSFGLGSRGHLERGGDLLSQERETSQGFPAGSGRFSGSGKVCEDSEDLADSELCGCFHRQANKQSAEGREFTFGESLTESPLEYSQGIGFKRAEQFQNKSYAGGGRLEW